MSDLSKERSKVNKKQEKTKKLKKEETVLLPISNSSSQRTDVAAQNNEEINTPLKPDDILDLHLCDNDVNLFDGSHRNMKNARVKKIVKAFNIGRSGK